MSFYQLFLANIKMIYRNWRGLFFNLFLPIALYVGLSMLRVPISEGANAAKVNYSAYLLPGMIALTIMQTGIFGLAYWLVDLKERGVIKRFLATPLSTFELVGSLIASRLVLIAFQILILTLIGHFAFHVHVLGSITAIFFLMVLGGIVFLSLGFLISSLAKTYDEAAPMTTVLNLIFTFLGNIFFPTEVFPKVLQNVAEKLPMTYLAEGMRNNFLEHWTLRQSLWDILSLAIWVCVIFAITTYTFKLKQD